MQQTLTTTKTPAQTIKLGEQLGQRLRGGEIIEFLSDLGGGKTTLVRGIVKGFGSLDPVASPTFTISSVYERADGKQLYHFDFYRLKQPGIVAAELAEVLGDPALVVVIEWGEIVHSVLPKDRLRIRLRPLKDHQREITLTYPEIYAYLVAGLT